VDALLVALDVDVVDHARALPDQRHRCVGGVKIGSGLFISPRKSH
jgi:hypothetical protein